jgi:hypothetical protein
MTEVKFPRVIEHGGHVAGIELVEGVVLSWACDADGIWRVRLSGVELHGEGVSVETVTEPVVH